MSAEFTGDLPRTFMPPSVSRGAETERPEMELR